MQSKERTELPNDPVVELALKAYPATAVDFCEGFRRGVQWDRARTEQSQGEPLKIYCDKCGGRGGYTRLHNPILMVDCEACDGRGYTIIQVKDALRAFCRELIDGAFDGAMFDGGEIQEMGVKYGLLREVQATERCGEICACAEVTDFPTTCYRFTDILQPNCSQCGHVNHTNLCHVQTGPDPDFCNCSVRATTQTGPHMCVCCGVIMDGAHGGHRAGCAATDESGTTHKRSDILDPCPMCGFLTSQSEDRDWRHFPQGFPECAKYGTDHAGMTCCGDRVQSENEPHCKDCIPGETNLGHISQAQDERCTYESEYGRCIDGPNASRHKGKGCNMGHTNMMCSHTYAPAVVTHD